MSEVEELAAILESMEADKANWTPEDEALYNQLTARMEELLSKEPNDATTKAKEHIEDLKNKTKNVTEELVENKDEIIKEVKKIKEEVENHVAGKASQATKFLIDTWKTLRLGEIPAALKRNAGWIIEAYIQFLVWTNRAANFIPDARARWTVRAVVLVTTLGSLEVVKKYADALEADGVLEPGEADFLRAFQGTAAQFNIRSIVSREVHKFLENPGEWILSALDPKAFSNYKGVQAGVSQLVSDIKSWFAASPEAKEKHDKEIKSKPDGRRRPPLFDFFKNQGGKVPYIKRKGIMRY